MEFSINLHHHIDLSNVGEVKEMLSLLRDLKSQGARIMSAISDFADKMSAHNAKVDTAVEGLTGDVADLKAQIAALQSSQGQITPADQALLDNIEAKAGVISGKLDALDALTPPAAPPG